MLLLSTKLSWFTIRTVFNAFDLLVRSYIDKFGERGDTDFTTVSGHIVSLFRRKPGDTAAQRLKLALLMRNTYTDIFRHLI